MLQWFLRFPEFTEFTESSAPFRENSIVKHSCTDHCCGVPIWNTPEHKQLFSSHSWIEFSRNTQNWQCWHCCTTSDGNKLEMIVSWMNYISNLLLSWCFELKSRWLITRSISNMFSKFKQTQKWQICENSNEKVYHEALGLTLTNTFAYFFDERNKLSLKKFFSPVNLSTVWLQTKYVFSAFVLDSSS